MNMKKVIIFLSIIFLVMACSFVYAKEENTGKKTNQEETTDKFFKNIVDSIEKTTEDSVNKIANDIKEIKKEKK